MFYNLKIEIYFSLLLLAFIIKRLMSFKFGKFLAAQGEFYFAIGSKLSFSSFQSVTRVNCNDSDFISPASIMVHFMFFRESKEMQEFQVHPDRKASL